MILVYILLLCIVATVVGKFVNRQGDDDNGQTAKWGSLKNFKFSHYALDTADPEENPRPVDDGTDYGYKEFD